MKWHVFSEDNVAYMLAVCELVQHGQPIDCGQPADCCPREARDVGGES